MSVLRTQIVGEFLVCVFCEKLPQEACLLPCLHSICGTCKNTVFSGINKCASCPKCNDPFTALDSEKLPPNQWLRNVIDIINITECSKVMFCTFCLLKNRQNEVVARCMTCFDLLCKECWEKYHTFTTQTRNHMVVSLTDLKSKKFEMEMKTEHSIPCPEHDPEFFRHYCKTCDVPVCRDCIIFQHKSHALLSMEEAIKKFEKGLCFEMERIEKDLIRLTSRRLKVVDQMKNINHHEENIKLKIETSCNSMINKISAQRRSLERELTQYFKKSKETLERETESGEKKIRHLNAALSFCKSMLKYGNDFEILSLQRMVIQRVDMISSPEDNVSSLGFMDMIPRFMASWSKPELQLSYETNPNEEVQNVSTKDKYSNTNTVDVATQCNTTEDGVLQANKDHKFDVDTQSFSQKQDQKGQIQQNMSCVANTLINKRTDIGIQCSIIPYSESLDEKISDKRVRNINCSFISSKRLSNINHRPKISCISWLKKKSFLAIDQSNSSVHFCSLASPGNPMMVENCVDCTVTSWCFAIRTGSSNVLVYELNSSSFLYQLSSVSVVAAVSPLSPILACISKSMISLKTKKKAQLHVMTLTYKEGKHLSMGNPRFGCILTSGKFAVSDWEKDFVYFFDENSVLFRKEFCSPGSISVDKEDLIYIADFFEHCIIATNFEGSFRKRIELIPYVFHPRSISISPDNELAVAFENCVALFQMNNTTDQ